MPSIKQAFNAALYLSGTRLPTDIFCSLCRPFFLLSFSQALINTEHLLFSDQGRGFCRAFPLHGSRVNTRSHVWHEDNVAQLILLYRNPTCQLPLNRHTVFRVETWFGRYKGWVGNPLSGSWGTPKTHDSVAPTFQKILRNIEYLTAVPLCSNKQYRISTSWFLVGGGSSGGYVMFVLR